MKTAVLYDALKKACQRKHFKLSKEKKKGLAGYDSTG
jgi:hypothetical protein